MNIVISLLACKQELHLCTCLVVLQYALVHIVGSLRCSLQPSAADDLINYNGLTPGMLGLQLSPDAQMEF